MPSHSLFVTYGLSRSIPCAIFLCMYESGGPLTKARFVSAIKSILTQSGMDDSLYFWHSFHIVSPGRDFRLSN